MFAETEKIIVERLKTGLTSDIHVLRQSELDQAKDARQFAPFVAVIYDGYAIGESSGNKRVQQIIQEWFVVVGAKSASGCGNEIAARDICSELAGKVINLLLGYTFENGSHLHILGAPGPVYEAGFCYLPIKFTNPSTFRGQQ